MWVVAPLLPPFSSVDISADEVPEHADPPTPRMSRGGTTSVPPSSAARAAIAIERCQQAVNRRWSGRRHGHRSRMPNPAYGAINDCLPARSAIDTGSRGASPSAPNDFRLPLASAVADQI
jgi:hypothetical protein